MSNKPERGIVRICALSALVVLLLGGGAARGKEKSLKERIDAEREIVTSQLRNANWRLEMNFQGLKAKRADAPAAATPFRRCCSFNIDKIEAGIQALGGIFEEMARCYERSGQESARTELATVRADLAAYTKLLGEMKEAATQEQAKSKGAAATQAYFVFDKGAAALPDCAKIEERKKQEKKSR